MLCAGAVFLGWDYPLGPQWLFLGLAAYGAVLWLRPRWWLVLLPVALIAVDFTRSTGRLYVGEADLAVLMTMAVLLLRLPPAASDLAPPLPVGIAALLLGCYGVSLVLGLVPLAPLDDNAFNNYFSHYNALRVGKGVVSAVVLWPFLARTLRLPKGGQLFALGMVAALLAVGLSVAAERIRFVGLFDFGDVFRVTGPFASMHIGGGHLGAFLALALPFAAPVLPAWRRPPMLLLLGAIAIISLYAVLVSFNRTAYAAVAVEVMVVGAGMLIVSRSWTRKLRLVVVALGSGALLATLGAVMLLSPFMRERFSLVGEDAGERLSEWRDDMELRDATWAAELFGMGVGSFPRLARERSHGRHASIFRIEHDGGRPYLQLEPDIPLYIGQYVAVRPGTRYRLGVDLRTDSFGATLVAFLCEKSMLYSFACRSPTIAPRVGSGWQHIELVLDSGMLGLGNGGSRPIEFAVMAAPRNVRLDVANLSLRDPSGTELIDNGDFARGMDRWLFTDDSHRDWRIENEVLMRWFEQGWLGLAAWIGAIALTLVRLGRRIAHGDRAALPFLASLVGFLICASVNSLLEAPRLATAFCLVLFAANAGRPDGDDARPVAQRLAASSASSSRAQTVA